MRRRDQSDPGSLDMLLDTICNIFGLLIFVAVIAAVLAQARTNTPRHIPTVIALPEPAQAPMPDAPDVDIETLGNQIEEAIKHVDDLTNALSALAPPDNAGTIPDTDLRHQIESLEAQVKDEQDRRVVDMRLPRRRAVVGRVPVQLVVTNDRLYILNDWRGWSNLRYPQADRCRFWTTWNPDAVDVNASRIIKHEECWRAGGQDIERWAHLLPDGGIDLSTPRGIARAKAALRVLDPRTHVASIKVTADSFDVWAPVRSVVLQRRVPYDVSPIELQSPLVFHDRIRSGTASAQ